MTPLVVSIKLGLIVFGVISFSKTNLGEKIGNFLPTPFWIYFIPILFSTFNLIPKESNIYDFIGLHVLTAALVLMLIGTPITSLLKLGFKSTAAMTIASITMVVGIVFSFGSFTRFMPQDSYKAAGAILATWVGGSANMIAVKELLNIPDSMMAPLIIVDTLLSYTWMALLIAGAGYQNKFDGWLLKGSHEGPGGDTSMQPVIRHSRESGNPGRKLSFKGMFETWIPAFAGMTAVVFVLIFGFVFGEIAIFIGKKLGVHFSFLTGKGWAILTASTLSVLLALTPLHKIEEWKASRLGMTLLYFVLASIGAKATLHAALDAPIFLLFGVVGLLIHGMLTLILGKVFKIPLFLLSTASQAAVGGPISAPIVAGVYRPGIAHVGVLMAIMGAILGTYVGLFGSWLCKFLELGIR